jgi:hypothetical protein
MKLLEGIMRAWLPSSATALTKGQRRAIRGLERIIASRQVAVDTHGANALAVEQLVGGTENFFPASPASRATGS